MPSMGDLLADKLHSAVLETPVIESEDVAIDIPDERRSEALTEWAELISGTGDKKSKAYKTARRNLERWSPSPAARARGAKPRRMTVKMRQRIQTIKRRNTDFADQLRGGADIKVRISWYSSRRPEWVPPHYTLPLDMDDVIALAEAGQFEAAGDLLWRQFLETYDVPNIEDWLENVELLELDIQA